MVDIGDRRRQGTVPDRHPAAPDVIPADMPDPEPAWVPDAVPA
jgi:hypothetical protein